MTSCQLAIHVNIALQLAWCRWKLIFGDPHLDNGGQFHIKLNLEADAPYDILGGPLKGVVKPVIRGVMESSKRLTNQEKDETLALMQQVHAADVACQEKFEQIKQCTVFHRKVSISSRCNPNAEPAFISTFNCQAVVPALVSNSR